MIKITIYLERNKHGSCEHFCTTDCFVSQDYFFYSVFKQHDAVYFISIYPLSCDSFFPLTGIPRSAVWLRNGSSRSLSWPGRAVPRPRATALGIFAFLHGPQDAASAVQHGPVSCRIRKPRPILQGETAMAYLQYNHSRIHLERF